MNKEETFCFNALKKAVADTFSGNYNTSVSIKDWKGEEITAFQEDLFSKTNTRVSEKWFYTYFKNESDKLPRIDMLNLLSKYVGYENWNAFKMSRNKPGKFKEKSKKSLFIALIIMLAFAFYFLITRKNEFHFCFIDHTKNTPIKSTVLDIKVLQENESPLYFKTDSLGCFSYSTTKDYVKFVVQSPYHKTDTIVRFIDSNINNTVRLKADDYTLMLYYYSSGNVKDWKKHRANLKALIHDDAKIYQLFDDSIGVEVFTKEDFIRLLTIPTNNLKRMKVLDKTTVDDKIVKLKFIVK